MTQQRSHAPAVIIGLLFVAGGVWMARNGCLEVIRGRASHAWPTTAGIVSESITDEYTETGYKYNVGGKEYRSWKVRLGSIGTPWSDAEIAKRYPVGKTVTVHYMRSDPSVAVLEPGHGAGSYLSLVVGPLVALLGGALAYVFLRKLLANAAGSRQPPPPAASNQGIERASDD